MALRFIDGFDHATGLPELSGRWIVTGAPTLTATGGRFNSGHVRLYGNTPTLARTFDNQPTWVLGFALRLPSASAYDTSTMIEFIDNTTTQCSLAINASRQLRAYRGADATLLATSSGTLAEERWYFIEIKLTIADTNGTYEVRVNGNTWISVARRRIWHTSAGGLAHARAPLFRPRSPLVPTLFGRAPVWVPQLLITSSVTGRLAPLTW